MNRPTKATVKRHTIDPTTDKAPNIPRKSRHPRFVYIHYPQGWEYIAEENPETGKAWGFLPKLKKIVAKAGANGVRWNGNRLDLTGAIQGHAAQGGKLINPTDSRLPEQYQNYVGYIETNDGGKHFTEIGAEVTVLPNGRALHNRDEVIPLFLAFRKAVGDSGILDPMLPEIKAMLVSDISDRLSLIGSRMHNNPHLQARYDKWQAKLDGIAADWEDYAATQGIARPVTTAPRKRARRKAASTPEA